MNRKILILLILILSLGGFLRVFRIGKESIWFDEFATYEKVSAPTFNIMLERMRKDETAPPLYFALLYAWGKLGRGLIWLRLFSALAGILALYFFYLLAREILDKHSSLFATFLLAISPYHVWYSQEMRMYVLLAFFTIISSLYCWKWFKSGKRLFAGLYIFFTLCGLYTHYHFLLILLAQNLFIFFERKRIKSWMKMQLLVLLAFFPWVFFLWKDLFYPGNSWIPALNVLTPFFIFSAYTLGIHPFVPVVLAWLTLLVAFVVLFKVGEEIISKPRLVSLEGIRFISVLFALPIVTALVISLFKPIISEGKRYLIISLPFFYLILAYGVSRLRDTRQVIAVYLLFALTFTFSLSSYYRLPQKRPWHKVADLLKQNYQRGKDGAVLEGVRYNILEFYGFKDIQLLQPQGKRVKLDEVVSLGKRYSRIWFISIAPGDTKLERVLFANFHCVGFRVANTPAGIIKIFLFDTTLPPLSRQNRRDTNSSLPES